MPVIEALAGPLKLKVWLNSHASVILNSWLKKTLFEWHEVKNLENIENHGVSFYEAQYAFLDENRVIAEDLAHSQEELRYFCFGLNKDRSGVLTVRFTYRSGRIRIYGAGYWRKGRGIYEQANSIH